MVRVTSRAREVEKEKDFAERDERERDVQYRNRPCSGERLARKESLDSPSVLERKIQNPKPMR